MEKGHTVQGQDSDIVGNNLTTARMVKEKFTGARGSETVHSQWTKAAEQEATHREVKSPSCFVVVMP